MAFLGIDLGTTGVKLIAISEKGKVVFRHFEGYELYTPKIGWVEEEPSDWWNAVLTSLKKAAEFLRGKVRALAVSGQMHGAVFLNERGEVIRRAILWNDTRNFLQRREMENKLGKEVFLKFTQNLPLEGFTAPKILWLKEKERENYSKLWKVVLPKDYINYKLTGHLYTDPTDASGTALYNVIEGKWSNNIIEKTGLKIDIFPEILKTGKIIGKISRRVAGETGLNPDCLVIMGGADNACGALGAGVVTEGQLLISIGSSGVILLPTRDAKKRDLKGRVHFFKYIKDLWYNMGVTLAAGLSLKWFGEIISEREEFVDQGKKMISYDFMVKSAEKVPLGSEGLYYLPYLNGERTPHLDAKARGIFLGFSLKHRKEHFIRSVLEGVSYSLRDCVEIIKEQNSDIKEARIIGGGAKSDLWVQIVSDVLNVPISTLEVDEGPALGAAILALGGIYGNNEAEETLKSISKIKRTFSPSPTRVSEYNKRYSVYRDIYKATADIMSRTFELERNSSIVKPPFS